MRWLARLTLVLTIVAAFGVTFALTPPRGSRSMRRFDAGRVAELELHLWQASHAKQRVHLFTLQATMLREQYHYSWATATIEAFHFARAAATFGDLTGNYDVVLPDLETGYATTRSWMAAGFDPRAVARAELAWWVARRVPDQRSPKHVGDLIADEYALLYETSRERVAPAARLRAEAAALRDAHADHPDWMAIGLLLQQSYRELLMGLRPRTSETRSFPRDRLTSKTVAIVSRNSYEASSIPADQRGRRPVHIVRGRGESSSGTIHL